MPASTSPTRADWEQLRVRIGTVLEAAENRGARDPAYQMRIDFGELGVLQSSARITTRYQPDDLIGRQVAAVTGFPALRIAGFRSDVLVLGVLTGDGVVLLGPDAPVAPGSTVA